MWNVVIDLGKPFTIDIDGQQIELKDGKVTIGFDDYQSALGAARYVIDHVQVQNRVKEYGRQPVVVQSEVVRDNNDQ